MIGTLFLVAIGLAVALVIGRMAVALVRFAAIVCALALGLFGAFAVAHGAAGFASHAHSLFSHLSWVSVVAVGVLVTAIGTLATIGAFTAHARVATMSAPHLSAWRLSRVARQLRRAGATVTASSLAHVGRVDKTTAIAWLARHPRYMPSMTTPLHTAARPK